MNRIVKWLFYIPLFYISFVFFRSKKICIYFGALDLFIDNAKYCYIYANQHYSLYQHIWLSKNKKEIAFLRKKSYNAVYTYSLKGMYYLLRAKYYIYDTGLEYGFLSGGAIRINLWHGIPLKKIGYDNVISDNSPVGTNWIKNIVLKNFAPNSLVLCTSMKLESIFCSAFNVDKSQIIYGGYYRNIPLLMDKKELIVYIDAMESFECCKLVNQLRRRETGKIFLYMPTFRDANSNFLDEAIPDFEYLNSFCQKNDILFLLKLHRSCEFPMAIDKYSNLKVIDNTLDIYPILPFTDGLITDYSSIFFDYALMDKKIFFYPFDIDDYKDRSRELYFQYEDIVGSSVSYSFCDLLNSLIVSEVSENVNVNLFDTPSEFDSLFRKLSMRRSGESRLIEVTC